MGKIAFITDSINKEGYNINTDLCKTCYNIFGIRNQEQCAKCKKHAMNVNIDKQEIENYRNGIKKHYTKKALKEMKIEYYSLMQKRANVLVNLFYFGNCEELTNTEDDKIEKLEQILAENNII